MDDVEAAFAAAIMWTAEMVMPPPEQKRPGRDWSGDAQRETKLQAATDAMRAVQRPLKLGIRSCMVVYLTI